MTRQDALHRGTDDRGGFGLHRGTDDRGSFGLHAYLSWHFEYLQIKIGIPIL
jgi:hypothetical protein